MEIKIRLDSMAEQKIYEINYKENLFTINGEIVDRSAIEIYKKLINIIRLEGKFREFKYSRWAKLPYFI